MQIIDKGLNDKYNSFLKLLLEWYCIKKKVDIYVSRNSKPIKTITKLLTLENRLKVQYKALNIEKIEYVSYIPLIDDKALIEYFKSYINHE